MESFKLFFVSFLSTVLIVSSSAVLAQNQLIEGVPDVYYLEEHEDGENVRVTACFRASEGQETSGEGLRSLDSNCDTVVEVSLADLESFASQLNSEIDSIGLNSNQLNEAFGILGGTASLVGLFVGLAKSLDGAFPKNPPKNPKAIAMGMAIMLVSAGALFGWGYLGFNANRNLANHARSQNLVQQLREGKVNGENYRRNLQWRKQRRFLILQRFTDFLNQYGRAVDSGSAS